MHAPDLGLILLIVSVAFGVAAMTLIAAAAIAARRSRGVAEAAKRAEARAAVAFLFDGQSLVDATPDAREFLAGAAGAAGARGEGSDRARLAGLLRIRYPGLDAALDRLDKLGRIALAPDDGGGETLRAEWQDGLTRIVLDPPPKAGGTPASGRAEELALAAAEAELAALRGAVEAGPAAIWRQAADGTIAWANGVYFDLAEALLGPEQGRRWPPPALFPAASAPTAAPLRVPLQRHGEAPDRWFQVHCQADADGLLCSAVPADELVRVEEALREFVQTLSKTFAHLPVGLAIFDRSRRLALFNPALTDLTTLEVDFLAARPTLFAVLDRLRDKRRIPEPRDYRSWRQRIAELEAAAAGGFVQENWTLPSGETYRVTGRPHPDGAVAFLFEDISAEVSLTRRFRTEIELGQSVLDSLSEAIAVFSPAGVLTMSNAAYAGLWGVDPGASLAEIGILDALRHWHERAEASPVWGDARDFLAERGERAEWSDRVRMKDGREMICRFEPLPGGATLVGFAEAAAAPAAQVAPATPAAKRGAAGGRGRVAPKLSA